LGRGADIAQIETVRMIGKGQMACPEGETLFAAEQFHSIAF